MQFTCPLCFADTCIVLKETMLTVGCTVKSDELYRHAGNKTQLQVLAGDSDDTISFVRLNHRAGRIDLFQQLVTDILHAVPFLTDTI